MSSIMRIKFNNDKAFYYNPKDIVIPAVEKHIPEWLKLSNMPCPGNIKHGTQIGYCRLGFEMQNLIQFFSTVKSIEKGSLIMQFGDDTEVIVSSDAQSIFYNALWYILLYSECSVFQYDQWERSNYIPTNNPEKLFYMLLSTHLINEYIKNPDKEIEINMFKEKIKIIQDILEVLLERIRENLTLQSDAVINGLVQFNNLLLLCDIDFETLYTNVSNLIKKEKSMIA